MSKQKGDSFLCRGASSSTLITYQSSKSGSSNNGHKLSDACERFLTKPKTIKNSANRKKTKANTHLCDFAAKDLDQIVGLLKCFKKGIMSLMDEPPKRKSKRSQKQIRTSKDDTRSIDRAQGPIPADKGWDWTECARATGRSDWRPGQIPKNVRSIMDHFQTKPTPKALSSCPETTFASVKCETISESPDKQDPTHYKTIIDHTKTVIRMNEFPACICGQTIEGCVCRSTTEKDALLYLCGLCEQQSGVIGLASCLCLNNLHDGILTFTPAGAVDRLIRKSTHLKSIETQYCPEDYGAQRRVSSATDKPPEKATEETAKKPKDTDKEDTKEKKDKKGKKKGGKKDKGKKKNKEKGAQKKDGKGKKKK